jgi:hypothetical protein
VTPDRRERVACETLDDAKRVTYSCAADGRPCELVVCGAYHRVLHHEFLNGHGDVGDPRSQMTGAWPIHRQKDWGNYG